MKRHEFLSASMFILATPTIVDYGESFWYHTARLRRKKPDKENYLDSAICIMAVPIGGDGKNGNDSFVDFFIDVEAYDNIYTAHGGFPNNTDIRENSYREMIINFTQEDKKAIFFDGIKNFQINILGHKPNQDGATNDKWNLRWEFIMNFRKGQVLSTGVCNPIEYHFKVAQTKINRDTETYYDRNRMISQRNIVLGVDIH